jgi:hypothetical protein
MKNSDKINNVNTKSYINKVTVVICLLVSMILIPIMNVSAQSVPAQDSLALVALYNSLNGDQWINKGGWLVDRVDTWRGVKTANVGTVENPEWRVTEFSSRANMTVPGTIPPDVGDLTYLVKFELRDEPLIGELPAEFGQLQFLRSLSFRGTQMTGELPWSSLVNAASLQEIRIDGGSIYGEIPAIVGDLNITEFNIEQNFLSGAIPGTISNWTELARFGVFDNNLTGEVPDMSGFSEMDVLRLGENPLTPGPIWSWLDGMSQIRTLFIVNSNRTGEIPTWFFDLLIRNLRVGESNPGLANALGGTLSEDFQNMPALEVLQIDGINWVGEIPAWMSFLDRVDFFNCSFTGTIPGSYATMSRLRIRNCPNIEGGIPEQFSTFRGTVFEWINDPVDGPWGFPWGNEHIEFSETFYGNPMASVGQLPQWLGDWGSNNIVLKGVGVTGTIPDGLNINANLGVLDLSENPGLTGTIPQWLETKNMTYVDFSNTGLTVPEIPSWMDNNNWRRMTTLGLAGLGIEGEIPSFVWTRYLELGNLDLSNNELTGTIPSTIGNLKRLSTLNLSNNLLEGELPASFEDTGYFLGQHFLVLLDLSGNENLSGVLPVRLTESTNMRVLRYDNTNIAAPDDLGFLNFISEVIPQNGTKFYPPEYADVRTSGLVGTSIEHSENPFVFHLGANYPNPFNPSTTLSYQIPESGHVTLTVYTVLGQVAATLVNEVKAAGRYEITFDASSLSSGVYLYRLSSGKQTLTRSMVLVK